MKKIIARLLEIQSTGKSNVTVKIRLQKLESLKFKSGQRYQGNIEQEQIQNLT
jgi:hypothetical protein